MGLTTRGQAPTMEGSEEVGPGRADAANLESNDQREELWGAEGMSRAMTSVTMSRT